MNNIRAPGAGQGPYSTCWFFAMLNGFLLSPGGQAIMSQRIHEYFETLNTNAAKAYFMNSSISLNNIVLINKQNKLLFLF